MGTLPVITACRKPVTALQQRDLLKAKLLVAF